MYRISTEGDGQQICVGETLEPLIVKVRDKNDLPAEGVPVEFFISNPDRCVGAELIESAHQTDISGKAFAVLMVSEGQYRVTCAIGHKPDDSDTDMRLTTIFCGSIYDPGTRVDTAKPLQSCPPPGDRVTPKPPEMTDEEPEAPTGVPDSLPPSSLFEGNDVGVTETESAETHVELPWTPWVPPTPPTPTAVAHAPLPCRVPVEKEQTTDVDAVRTASEKPSEEVRSAPPSVIRRSFILPPPVEFTPTSSKPGGPVALAQLVDRIAKERQEQKPRFVPLAPPLPEPASVSQPATLPSVPRQPVTSVVIEQDAAAADQNVVAEQNVPEPAPAPEPKRQTDVAATEEHQRSVAAILQSQFPPIPMHYRIDAAKAAAVGLFVAGIVAFIALYVHDHPGPGQRQMPDAVQYGSR